MDMATYIRFPPKYSRQVFKSAGTGAINDIDEGALYIVTVGGNAAGTSAGIANIAFRLRFYDDQG